MDLIKVLFWIAYFVALYFLVFWFTFYFSRKDRIKDELDDDSKLKHYPLVSVIVPAYNEEKTIVGTLKSLVELDYPKDRLELMVINDGSRDRTEEVVLDFIKRNKSRNIRYIFQKNAGKAKALNKGLKLLKGEYFACLDADSFVDRDSLKRMLRLHFKDDDLAVVTPILRVNQPKNWIQKFQRLEYLTSMVVVKLMSYLDCNFVAPGPFSLYKTHIARKVGGFAEENLVEDQEIAYKFQKAHYRIRQCSNAYVRTVAPSNIRAFGKQRNRWLKGTLINIFDYRFMIFNRRYGDFGFLQMPITLFAYVMAIIALISLGYYTLKPFFLFLKDLYLINFDIFAYWANLEFTFKALDTNVMNLLLIYSMLLLSVMLLYFASRMTDDRVRKYGFFYIVPYFFVYFLILSFITIKVLLELLIGKKQKW